MKRSDDETESSRRDFFRSFLAERSTEESPSLEEERAVGRRVSLLALEYGKNEAQLTKLKLEPPRHIGKGMYFVNVSGEDADGQARDMVCEVDSGAGTVRELDMGWDGNAVT